MNIKYRGLAQLVVNLLPIIIIIATAIVIGILINKNSKRKHEIEKYKAETDRLKINTNEEYEKEKISAKGAYRKTWLFSYNEKDAYFKLKAIADELGMTVFAKVRLLDLIEPIKGTERYRTYLNKIQSKHVDFVLCDNKLVARYIIELDDNSHNKPERKERDAYVDDAVTSAGYKIIHVKAISDGIINELINK